MSAEAKIDWDAKLINFDGEEIKKNNNPDSATATLRFVACQAINAQMAEDQGLAKGVKRDRAYLIKRISRKEGPGALKNEDMEFIKARIELTHSSWIVGECFDLLEGKNGEAPKEKAD